ncbi:hypothetical protein ACVWWQ_002372 [Rhodanobacter sp. TND4EL1]
MNDWLDGTRCAVGWRHDSAALKARQCRDGCGLRAKNEPLTTKITLRHTARTAKQEEAKCANARETQRTTKRAKENNAGQPEPA